EHGTAWRGARSDRGRVDFRKNCQGSVRDRLERGRRSARHRGTTRDEAGYGPGRDRKSRRGDHREEPRQGCAGEIERKTTWLVRRPNDESVRRQGESAGGE